MLLKGNVQKIMNPLVLQRHDSAGAVYSSVFESNLSFCIPPL